MDLALDKAAGKFARKDGRLYHYVLPAPHVLLLPSAVVVLAAKFQAGRISADGDTWRQAGIGMRRIVGREGLGNPAREAEAMVTRMSAFIDEAAPAAAGARVDPFDGGGGSDQIGALALSARGRPLHSGGPGRHLSATLTICTRRFSAAKGLAAFFSRVSP